MFLFSTQILEYELIISFMPSLLLNLLLDHPDSGASALIHVNHDTILYHVINYIPAFSGLNKHLFLICCKIVTFEVKQVLHWIKSEVQHKCISPERQNLYLE